MLLFLLILAGGALWLIANFWLKTLFFNNRFFWACVSIVFFFLTSFFYPMLFEPVKVIFVVFLLLLVTDGIFLFAFRGKPVADRIIAARLSNGDKNPVVLQVRNEYPFTVKMRAIDELPDQFQSRNNFFETTFKAGQEKKFNFFLRPVER